MSEVNFKDPYCKGNKLERMLWTIVWLFLAKPFPRNTTRKWKTLLVKMFDAKVHSICTIYSRSKIYMP